MAQGGGLVGTGPDASIALLFIASGLLAALTSSSGYLVPAIRHAEALLLDHEQAAASR